MVILHTPMSVYVHFGERRPQPIVIMFDEEVAYQIRSMAGERGLSIETLIVESLRLHKYWQRHGLYTDRYNRLTGI